MPSARKLALMLCALSFSGAGHAQNFSATLGYENVNPSSGNGVIAGADADVDDAWAFTGSIAYHFDDSWSVDLWTGLDGFDHEVSLAGLGTVATLTHRPTALGVNYHFNAGGTVRPYIGAGYNWVNVGDETGVGALTGVPLRVENADGVTLTAGIDFEVTEVFFVRGNVRRLSFESDVFAGGDVVGTADVDPLVWGLSAGFRF